MKLTLRPYQKDAVEKVLHKLKADDNKKIGVFMPTGSGKTVVMAEVVEQYLKEKSGRHAVLILSHKSDLVTQTISFFEKHTDLNTGKMQGGNMPPMFSKVVISTMQSSKDANRIDRWKKYAINSDVSLIIIDECHYAPVKTYEQIFQILPEAKILGFTATPWRQRHNMSNWFDTIAYTISLGDLIEENVLLKPNLVTIKFDVGSLEERIESCLRIAKENEKRSGVVYVQTIEDAEGFRNAFISFGLNADLITSNTPKAARIKILEAYRKGDIKILINVNVLTEGIDAPIAEYLIMPFGTKSPTVFQQRVGRLLRTYKDQEEAIIYIYGDAPSIAKGTYQKILNATLKDGSKNPLKREDVFDDLEWLKAEENKDTQKIEWTQKYCNIINKLVERGKPEFATLLQFKRFPKKYLKNLAEFEDNLKMAEVTNATRVISDKQIEILVSKGFNHSDVHSLRQADASAIIASIFSWENRYGEFTVKFGKFAGKHVSEIPGPYLGWMKRNNPQHPIFKLVAKWRKGGSIVPESTDTEASL